MSVTFPCKSILGSGVACLLAGVLAGCESLDSVTPEGFSVDKAGFSFDASRDLPEPDQIPEYAPLSYAALRRIEEVPTELRFDVCDETAQITKDMLWGSVGVVGTVPFGSIVRRQFGNALSEHFHPIDDGRRPQLKITVRPCMVVIRKTAADRVLCDAEFKVVMTDVVNRKVLFEDVYRRRAENAWDGLSVPEAVYRSVQGAAADFLAALSKQSGLIARLEGAAEAVEGAKGPEFVDYSLRPGQEKGVFTGTCQTCCNGWDSVRAANWLRTQLETRCRDQLGVEFSRVRVIYEENAYDAATKVWKVSFRAFARSAWMLDYDAVTRTGVCVADLALVGKSAKDASEAMRGYVLQEMNRRAGVVTSDSVGNSAQVRFVDFKTDARYNLIRCTFKLVY